MNAVRTLIVTLYAIGYGVTVYVGAAAVSAQDHRQAVILLSSSALLLVGIYRELRHAAVLIATVAVYRHGGEFPGHVHQLRALECATAVPPDCRCETWWTSLGHHHAPHCPALDRSQP